MKNMGINLYLSIRHYKYFIKVRPALPVGSIPYKKSKSVCMYDTMFFFFFFEKMYDTMFIEKETSHSYGMGYPFEFRHALFANRASSAGKHLSNLTLNLLRNSAD